MHQNKAGVGFTQGKKIVLAQVLIKLLSEKIIQKGQTKIQLFSNKMVFIVSVNKNDFIFQGKIDWLLGHQGRHCTTLNSTFLCRWLRTPCITQCKRIDILTSLDLECVSKSHKNIFILFVVFIRVFSKGRTSSWKVKLELVHSTGQTQLFVTFIKNMK